MFNFNNIDLTEPAESSLEERLTAELTALGLEFPRRPEGEEGVPDLPPDLTNVTPTVIGQLMTELSSWLAYINGQAALARSAAKMAKARRDVAKKLGATDEEIADLMLVAVEAEVRGDVLTALERATTRKKETVSREIARLGLFDPETAPRGHRT